MIPLGKRLLGGDQDGDHPQKIKVACQQATQVSEERDARHDELDEDEQQPWVPRRRDLHQPKQAASFHPTEANVDHQQPEQDPRKPDTTLHPEFWVEARVCQEGGQPKIQEP